MESGERLLSPVEVAKLLGVGRRWVVLRIRSGEITAYRVGLFWRVPMFEVRRFLNRNRAVARLSDVER